MRTLITSTVRKETELEGKKGKTGIFINENTIYKSKCTYVAANKCTRQYKSKGLHPNYHPQNAIYPAKSYTKCIQSTGIPKNDDTAQRR